MEAGVVIDCCVHHDWRSQDEIVAYLPAAWREYVGDSDPTRWGLGAKNIRVESEYRSPLARRHPTLGPTELAAHLAGDGVDVGLLAPVGGLLLGADNNPRLALELCRATNKWTAEQWLADPRSPFLGGIVIENQLPEEAANEIRKYADHDRFCVVHMGGNGFGKPYGHPVYRPIHKAAAESGLPIVIHTIGDSAADNLSQAAAGGLASFAGEHRALAGQVLMTHLTSMIGQGVFHDFPELKVLAVGGGIAWVPAYLWRFDTNFMAFGREAPWLREPPSRTFHRNVYVGTYRI